MNSSHQLILLSRAVTKLKSRLKIEMPFRLRMSSLTMMRAFPLRAFACKASPSGRGLDLGNVTLVGSKVKFLLFHRTRMPKLMGLNFTEVRLLMKRDREANFISLSWNSLSRLKG